MKSQDQSIKNELPIGNQLIDILREKPDDKFSPAEIQRLSELLEKTRSLAQSVRKQYGYPQPIDVHEANSIVFGTDAELMDSQAVAKYTACMAQFTEDMLKWCIQVIDTNKKDGLVPRELLLGFALDASWIGYLGNRFSTGRTSRRSYHSFACETMREAARAYLFGTKPRRLVSEFMEIFELRQAIEIAVKDSIGIGKITPVVVIDHSAIWELVKKNITARGLEKTELTLNDVAIICRWTNQSIHKMTTDWVPAVWKAMMILWDVFYSPEVEGYWSVNEFFETTDEKLSAMREKVAEKVKRKFLSKDDTFGLREFKIEWKKPVIRLVDKHGNPVQKPAKHVITYQITDDDRRKYIEGQMKRIENLKGQMPPSPKE